MRPSTVQLSRSPSCFRSTMCALAPVRTDSTRRGGSPQRKPKGGTSSLLAQAEVSATKKTQTNVRFIRCENYKQCSDEQVDAAPFQLSAGDVDYVRTSSVRPHP